MESEFFPLSLIGKMGSFTKVIWGWIPKVDYPLLCKTLKSKLQEVVRRIREVRREGLTLDSVKSYRTGNVTACLLCAVRCARCCVCAFSSNLKDPKR